MKKIAIKTVLLVMIITLIGCTSIDERDHTAIDLATRRIGVGIGSGADIILSQDENITLYRYEVVTEAAFALSANKLDAIATEVTTADNIIKANSNFKKLPEIIGFEDYAMVVSDKSPVSASQLNQYIDNFLLTQNFYNMTKKWIGTDLTNVKLDEVENHATEELVVGINAEYVPFEYIGSGGQLMGFTVDFVEHMGKSLGVKIVYYESAFTSLFPALKSGKIDIIISSVAITQERLTNYTMTSPYYSNEIVYMVNK